MSAAILPFRSPDRALAARSTDAAIVAGVYQRAIEQIQNIRFESKIAPADLDAIKARLDRLLVEATDPARRGAAQGAGANAGEGEGSCSLLPLSLPRRGSFLEV